MLQTSTLKFLKDLKKNNNKPWFDAHRKEYEAAKDDFTLFIQVVIDQHAKNDPSLKNLVAKDCLFRINRDVRFSKDKSPYKTNFGAHINKGGRKSMQAGYYIHLEPGKTFAGGGLWQPMPDELKKIRQEIDYNFPAFRKLITAKKFKSVYGDLDKSAEMSLSRVPKGYEPDNPAGEYLKLKSFVTGFNIKDSDLGSKQLANKVVNAFDAMHPLIEFLNKAFQ